MTPGNCYSKILVPTDGSEYSYRAAEQAVCLAKNLGSSIVILYVVDDSTAFQSGIHYADNLSMLENTGKEATAKIKSLCDEKNVPARVLLVKGSPKSAIVKVAEQECSDCIVIGSLGMSAIERVLLGSVSESVMRHAKCPVLMVRSE